MTNHHFIDGNFTLSLNLSNNKNYSFDDNNVFKENYFKGSMMTNRRVVTHKKMVDFSSDKKSALQYHSYTLNLCNTRQSDILAQLNFVGSLNSNERRLL